MVPPESKNLLYIYRLFPREIGTSYSNKSAKKVTRFSPLPYRKNAIYVNKYCNSYSLNNEIKSFEKRLSLFFEQTGKTKNMKKTKVIILSSLFALTFGGILTSCGENNPGSTESSKQNVGEQM